MLTINSKYIFKEPWTPVKRTGIVLFVSAGITLVLISLGYWLLNGQLSSIKQSTTTGRALIGGSFNLVDQDGNAVTEKNFLGRYALMYFGYTSCPDICPTELLNITEALEQLGLRAKQVIPVFITVDPERDTIPVMKDYAMSFHPRLRALTGTKEQIRAVASAYRVYYNQTESSEEDDFYLVDHTSLVYLMGPEGEYITQFRFGTSADVMGARINQLLIR